MHLRAPKFDALSAPLSPLNVSASTPYHCRVIVAHVRQSMPDPGVGSHGKILQTFSVVLSLEAAGKRGIHGLQAVVRLFSCESRHFNRHVCQPSFDIHEESLAVTRRSLAAPPDQVMSFKLIRLKEFNLRLTICPR